jgi:uncharacterized protein
MTKKNFLLLLICSLAFCLLHAQKVIPKPTPARLVVDYASVLLPEQEQILEQQLVALDDSTSNQIAIVLVKTLNDLPIEDVAVNTFRSWGIGSKKNNNGILILAAIDDRQVRIEVGYGLEGAIPDIVAKSIIDNDIKPNFQQGNYFRGLNQAIQSLSKAAAGEYAIPREQDENNGLAIFIVILLVVLALLFIGGSNNRGGGMFSRRGYGGFIPPIFFGGGGWGSGGRSSGGGGFGGFGGGSSGGGGASGNW